MAESAVAIARLRRGSLPNVPTTPIAVASALSFGHCINLRTKIPLQLAAPLSERVWAPLLKAADLLSATDLSTSKNRGALNLYLSKSATKNLKRGLAL